MVDDGRMPRREAPAPMSRPRQARAAPGWALLPIAALFLPSLVMASSGLSIDPSAQGVAVAPRALAELPDESLQVLHAAGLLTRARDGSTCCSGAAPWATDSSVEPVVQDAGLLDTRCYPRPARTACAAPK